MFLILGKIFLYLFIAFIIIVISLFILAWFLEMKNPSEISNKKPIKRNNYVVAYERIKHESNRHKCISCEKEFNFKLSHMYQEFGNCGGLSGELFVDCRYCNCKNEVYRCV